MKVLVTGATGYIGGRLVPRLLERGHEVRVLVRNRARLGGRPWAGRVEVVEGDLRDPLADDRALQGCDAAYYLVHAMQDGGDFAEEEARETQLFATLAARAGVGHVIYLGGLLPTGEVSEHLRSRATVGRILRETCPTTEFRAGPIIGSGSASFEMVRYLTERLPLMIVPRWVKNDVQPIAVRDVLSYLLGALERGPLGVVEIGADVVTFKEMMLGYARARGLRRRIWSVPVLTPNLAAVWVSLVTPIPLSLARPLVEGIVEPVTGDTTRARSLFPEIEPVPYAQAVALALDKLKADAVETRWSPRLPEEDGNEVIDREGMVQERRTVTTAASAASLFRSFSSLGGDRGWPAWGWAWRLRGFFDVLVGGPGLKRGRRARSGLYVGEAVDFWRVEQVEPPQLLVLRAEMRVPGRAWLRFEACPEESGRTRLVQTALFAPRGLTGALYWYLLFPAHLFIFSRMARAIVAEAERIEKSDR